jgi:hypothetical protein
MCFSEEVLFLREEMRRVLAFLDWHAGWWDERRFLFTGLSHDEEEGVIAYASKQAHIRRSMRSTFDRIWHSSHELIQLGIGADNDILDLDYAAGVDLLNPPPEELLARSDTDDTLVF